MTTICKLIENVNYIINTCNMNGKASYSLGETFAICAFYLQQFNNEELCIAIDLIGKSKFKSQSIIDDLISYAEMYLWSSHYGYDEAKALLNSCICKLNLN